jgi:hypothetical protein
MHEAVREYVAQFGTLAPVNIVDIGGRNLNGSIRGFFPNGRFTTVDIQAARDVDVVADARTWRPTTNGGATPQVWDVVICCEVFEHVEAWREIVATCYEVCRPGGSVIFTCAGDGRAPHSGIAATPITPGEYYGNVSPGDLAEAMLAAGFDVTECAQRGLDVQACGQRPARWY